MRQYIKKQHFSGFYMKAELKYVLRIQGGTLSRTPGGIEVYYVGHIY